MEPKILPRAPVMMLVEEKSHSSVSQILSIPPVRNCVIICLTLAGPHTGCDYYPEILIGRAILLLLCLASRGVYQAFLVTSEAVSSYLTFSPLPSQNPAVYSLRHCPSCWLQPTVPSFQKARYPMMSGLSSTKPKSDRDHPKSGWALFPKIEKIARSILGNEKFWHWTPDKYGV